MLIKRLDSLLYSIFLVTLASLWIIYFYNQSVEATTLIFIMFIVGNVFITLIASIISSFLVALTQKAIIVSKSVVNQIKVDLNGGEN